MYRVPAIPINLTVGRATVLPTHYILAPLSTGSVASYDTRPGDEVGLFYSSNARSRSTKVVLDYDGSTATTANAKREIKYIAFEVAENGGNPSCVINKLIMRHAR